MSVADCGRLRTAMNDEQAAAATPKFCYYCGKPANAGVLLCWNCAQPVVPPAPGQATVTHDEQPAPHAAQPAAGYPNAVALPKESAPASRVGDWRKYAGVLAMGFAALWKYKFAIYIALRSLSLFGHHVGR